MLHKDPDKRYATMDDVRSDLLEIHDALRRSRSHSAGPRPAAAAERGRARPGARARGARAARTSRPAACDKAVAEMEEALALDPECDEAADVLWRAGQRLRGAPPERRPARPRDRAARGRAAGPGRARPRRGEARQALAELALIAPDDPRVADLCAEGRRSPAGIVDTAGRARLDCRRSEAVHGGDHHGPREEGGAPPARSRSPGRTPPAPPSTRARAASTSAAEASCSRATGTCWWARASPWRIQIPDALRKHFGDRPVYHVRAVICRVESFEGEQAHRIGARFLGEAR